MTDVSVAAMHNFFFVEKKNKKSVVRLTFGEKNHTY